MLRVLAAVFGFLILAQGGLLAARMGLFDRPLPDFPATDHVGRPAKLADFRGRWVVVFFGYTRCPDVCPRGLENLAKVLRELGPHAAKVQGLFVSLDPARDGPGVLREYLPYFHPGLAGFHVRAADLTAFTRSVGATFSAVPGDPAGNIEHTAYFHVVDPRGVPAKEPILPPLTAPELRTLMGIEK